jgi:hypothetical protein
MNAVDTIEYRGYSIEVHQDEDPSNPRKEFDHFGHMICWHRRYNLGDEDHPPSPEDWLRGLAGDHVPFSVDGLSVETLWKIVERYYLVLPLYLYDHSGITISTGRFSCPWDSGQVGWIYASHKEIRKNWSVKCVRHKVAKHDGTRIKAIDYARELLEGEVKEYDQYLTGQVYGYVVKDKDGEDIDSCLGYFGDPDDYMLGEARSAVDYHIKGILKDHCEQLKEWIRHRVPLDKRQPCAA